MRTGALLLVAAGALPASVLAGPPARDVETAVYRVEAAAPWRVLAARERPGYRLRLSSPDGRSLVANVEVHGAPFLDEAHFPPDPASLAPEARALVGPGIVADEPLDRTSRFVTRGARTVLEAVERVVGFTSRRIRYEPPGQGTETASGCLSRGRGSCVGRSLLAEELLRRAGVPARQVTGILTVEGASELAADARPFYGTALSGVRHRWIEAWVPGLGWVPSDPAGLANTVTARHVELSAAPGPDFRLEIVSRTPELKRPRLALLGQGVTLGRPRTASLVVRNPASPSGGSVVLLPANQNGASDSSRLVRTGSDLARFEGVPTGDYRVVWRRPDGRTEAASLRVDGPASVELSTGQRASR